MARRLEQQVQFGNVLRGIRPGIEAMIAKRYWRGEVGSFESKAAWNSANDVINQFGVSDTSGQEMHTPKIVVQIPFQKFLFLQLSANYLEDSQKPIIACLVHDTYGKSAMREKIFELDAENTTWMGEKANWNSFNAILNIITLIKQKSLEYYQSPEHPLPSPR
ncbi:MAG: hypothetical protein NT149_04965 [Candidatus Gottesmanbacteria bacterium]|nr:hypothetical protein [Candidatus Gottesmanbacteria bacterium]